MNQKTDQQELDTPLGRELKNVVKNLSQDAHAKKIIQKMSPYITAGLYIGGGLLLVWASQFVFMALSGAIKQYKNLRRSIKEQ